MVAELARRVQIIQWCHMIHTMWIDRLMEWVQAERARTRPFVLLTGARQTGKTALVKRVFRSTLMRAWTCRARPSRRNVHEYCNNGAGLAVPFS